MKADLRTYESYKKRPPIIACQDDKSIIKRMKQAGIWSKMKEYSKFGGTVAVINGDELFVRHGVPGDTGYSFFKSEIPGDLLLVAAMATDATPATTFERIRMGLDRNND